MPRKKTHVVRHGYTQHAHNTNPLRPGSVSPAAVTNLVQWKEGETSIDNPLWLDERTVDDLEFGEWTMDLDKYAQGMDSLGNCATQTVTVVENNKKTAGFVGFSGAKPEFAKPCMLVAKAGETVNITASRTVGGDGDVAARVTSTADKSFSERLEWKNHGEVDCSFKYETKEADVGKTVYLKLANPEGGVKLAAGRTVAAIQVIAGDAPMFESESVEIGGVQWTTVENTAAIEGLAGDVFTVARISGSLPMGLTFGIDGSGSGAEISDPACCGEVEVITDKTQWNKTNGADIFAGQ